MHFSDMKYERPDFDALETGFREKLARFAAAGSVEAQAALIEEINGAREEVRCKGMG